MMHLPECVFSKPASLEDSAWSSHEIITLDVQPGIEFKVEAEVEYEFRLEFKARFKLNSHLDP